MPAKRVPFGGYVVSFKSVADTPLSAVFGNGEVTPSMMTKKLWEFVKKKGLMKK